MIFRAAALRKGKTLAWIAGILLLIFTAALVYQRYVHQGDHHVQDDTLVQGAKDAKLNVVKQPALQPGDSPQWRGSRRDGIYRDENLLTEWPAGGLKELWRSPSGNGYSSLAVAGGRIFSIAQRGEQDAVVCWDAISGKEHWAYPYGSHFKDSEGSGARSTPCVDDNCVYAVGGRGEMLCLDAANGKRIWRRDLINDFGGRLPKWGVSFSPLVEGDLVYAMPGARGASIMALDKMTGDVRWKALDDRPGYSSPIITEAAETRQVLFFTGENLVSVEPQTGKVYWSFPWETKYNCNIATPIVRGDYVFISSGYGKGCATIKVVKEGSELKAKQVFSNWRMKNHFSTSVYHDEHVYGFDESYLTCMEMVVGDKNPEKAGERRWKSRKVNKGSLLVVNDSLIILGEQGKLWLAKASPNGFEPKASFQVSERKCWTVPVVANGKLYVRDEKELICYDLSKPN